jgi:hypothetical protein
MLCPFLSAARHEAVRCIGAACACWRTAPPVTPETGARLVFTADNVMARSEEDAGPRPAAVPDSWEFSPFDGDNPAGWIEPTEEAHKRLVGYCGLAGSPFWGDA